MTEEHEQLIALAVELRDLLFDDASDTMQGSMVGCPVECVAFAKWWIQRAKGLPVDEPMVVFRNTEPNNMTTIATQQRLLRAMVTAQHAGPITDEMYAAWDAARKYLETNTA